MAANHRSIRAHIHTWPQIRDAAEPKTHLERPTPGIRQPELTDGVHLNRLARWISRSLTTMLSEFKLVDCRSLDVLLVCADDLTHSTLYARPTVCMVRHIDVSARGVETT